MSGFAAAGEPGTDALAGLSRVVFSTALREAEWANTQLVAQDPAESVRAMNEEGIRPMRTIGSLTLCRSLLEAGLVATRQVAWHARCHGSGRRSDACPKASRLTATTSTRPNRSSTAGASQPASS